MPEIPDNAMFNMKPNALIYGTRYDRNRHSPASGLRYGHDRKISDRRVRGSDRRSENRLLSRRAPLMLRMTT
jgi:hypothetical protein